MSERDADPVGALVGRFRAVVSPLRGFLKELHAKYAPLGDGRLADYIPELARADPAWFGISVATVDGQVFEYGDIQREFTIQSISKAFVYGLALEDHGRDYTLSRVGVEPTGDAFNSVIRLDQSSKRPHNPMVNAGAIATASLVKGDGPADRLNRMLAMLGRYMGRKPGRTPTIDMPVFTSERATGNRNRALAYLMLNFGMIDDNIEEHLDLYFKQCAVLVTCHDLAMMAATLANRGVNPATGERAVDSAFVRDILSTMYTCGMYDFAGEWAYRIGLPAKSGVGGGILAVVPGQGGIGVFSPLLDERGNSVRGIKVCEELSQRFGLHVFEGREGLGEAGERVSDAIGAAADARAVLREMERRFQALVNAVIPIGVSLLGARDFPRMLETILVEAKSLCRADGGTIYLCTDDDHLRFAIVRNDSIGIAFGGTTGVDIPFAPLPLTDPATGMPNRSNVATYVALTGTAVNIPDAYTADGFEFSGTVAFDQQTGYRSRSFLTVALCSQGGKVIGVLQLLNARDQDTGEVIPFDPGFQPVVESLSTLAAAALEVYLREEGLRRQIETLHIQIDEAKRARHVNQITESDYFRRLQLRAKELRRGG